MPAPSDEALSRCNLNLFATDKTWLYHRYGHGWSEIVRNLVRNHIQDQTLIHSSMTELQDD